MAVIYRYFHTETQMSYIGCGKDYRARLRSHRCYLKKGNHKCKPLQEAWDSDENWEIEILEDIGDAPVPVRRERELAAMESYSKKGLLLNVYRISYEMPDHVRQRGIANAAKKNKGRPLTEEHKQKIREAHKGRKKPHLGDEMRARWADPEWRERVLASRLAKIRNKHKM